MHRLAGWFFVAIFLLLMVGCSTGQIELSDADCFRLEYESLNGTYDEYGQAIRSVSIPEDNPMVYSSYTGIIERIKQKESFVVYFGYADCPWCRSTLEALIESANNNGLDEIYYVDVSDSRDTAAFIDGAVVQLFEGAEGYDELLTLLYPVLEDYILSDAEGNAIYAGEKRIYAPNVIAVKDGIPVGIASDTPLLMDPYEDLTTEIYNDMLFRYDTLFSLLDH